MPIEPPGGGEGVHDPGPADALDALLLDAAPLPLDDDAALDDPGFDAGRLAAWVRGEGALDDDAVRALAASPARRALLAHLTTPLPARTTTRLVDALAPPRRRRAPMLGLLAAVALAAAAAVLLWPRPPPLPDYTPGALGGGAVEIKSTDVGGAVFVPTSRLRWVLVPATAPDHSIAARAYESAPPGTPLRVLPTDAVRVTPQGAVVVEAGAAQLFGTAYGPRTLYVAISGDVGALDDAAGEAPAARSAEGVRWYATPLDYRAE